MQDRLADLRRQRALIQEHLDWIDREIIRAERQLQAGHSAAHASATPAVIPPGALVGSAAPPAPAAQTLAPLSAAAITTPPHLAQADAILDEYRVPTNTLKSDVRKGCLLYFAGAFVLLGAGIALLWLAFRR